MARVSGYSEDDVDVLIEDFQLVISQAMQRATDRTAANLRPAVVATGVVASSSAGLSPDDIAVFSTAWEEEIDGVLTPYVGEVYTGSAIHAAIGIGDAFPDDLMPGIPLVPDQFAVTYMQTVTNRLVGVGNELWEDIRNELLNGLHAGDSIEQIAARISHVAGVSQRRATTIARTEMHGAAEAGSQAQMSFMGWEPGSCTKEWVAVTDGRTRLSHSLADGQRVGVDEMFIIGGSHLKFPGDPAGSPGQTINCRCTTVFEVDEPPPFRCNGALTADASQSSYCVQPTPHGNADNIASALQAAVYNAFMQWAKMSPAHGGAKIHKELKSFRDAVKGNMMMSIPPDALDGVSDWDILAVVDKYYVAKKDTFSHKYTEWIQSPAGKKATGGITVPPQATHIVTPTTSPISYIPGHVVAPPRPHIPDLPPVAPKPSPGEIKYTGKTLGSHGAQVWVNPTTGERWLFKPQQKFMTDLDIGIAKIQSKARVTRPGMYEITLDGQHGSIQFMFESTEAWPGGTFDPLKLTALEIATMQREQIFDWMISNFDTHSGQWIRLQDGTLFGTDKGQAFKFFGKDKLDWDYVPVTPLGSDKLTYSQMWKAFVQGKNIDLQDPTTGELGEYIEQLMAIPDDEYRKLLQPYAEFREKAGIGTAKGFLDAAVARKKTLKHDFEEFWARAETERVKHVPKPPPKAPEPAATPAPVVDAQTQANLDAMAQAFAPGPVPVVPTAPTKIGTGVLGNIDAVPPYVRELVWDAWIELADGKKVTPAWGGAKIFKMLDELEKLADKSPTLWGDMAGLDHLQLLRILDDQGGFKGKPKTYESIVTEWLDSPQSTNTMLKLGYTSPPTSLKKIVMPGPTTGPKPVVAPSASTLTETAKAQSAIDRPAQKQTPSAFFAYANDYDNDEVMGYMLDAGGDYLRASKFVSGANTGVRVERLSIDGKKWVTQDIHYDWNSMMTSVYEDADGLSLWSIVLPAKKTTGAPTSLVGKTKIAGKAPGDEVGGLDIWESRYQWKDGDVIGTTKYGSAEFRLVSDGQGNITLQTDTQASGWIDLKTFKHDLKAKQKSFGVTNNAKWKLTGDVLESKKPSILTGFDAGDHVTTEQIWTGSFNASPGDTVAYAQTPAGLLKIHFDSSTGTLSYSAQTSPHAWSKLGEFHTKDHLEFALKDYDWYAAGAKGEIPDALKAGTPGKTVPGVKPMSNVPGKLEGEDMLSGDFVAFYDSSPAPGTVAAHGVGQYSGTEYRVVYGIDDELHIELKLKGATSWQEFKIVGDVNDIIDVQVTWKASTDSFTPAMPTPIKTNPLGDTLATSADVWQHYTKLGTVYENGDVIATRTSGGWQPIKERLVYQDGYVVKQTQTAAGSWTKTSVLTQQWQLSSTYTKWTVEAPGTKITKAQQTAIKKHISKNPLPPPGAAGAQPGSKSTSTKKAAKKAAPVKAPKQGPATPASVPFPSQPFNMVPVDLTPWNDTEREAIFQYFRTNHHIYTSSSPDAIWAALQATKSHFQTSQGGKYLNLNEIEILRILDERSSLKHGVTDTHPFESKIVNWLKTPQGKAYVNKKIDAPIAAVDVPVPMHDLTSGGPLDTQKYAFVTRDQSLKNRQDSHARYGGWKTGEKEALKNYTGGVYTSWNDAIRRGDLGSYRAKIIKMQQGMRPSVRPMILHRKVGFAELNDPGITSYETLLPYVGRTYVNRGFNSTSFGTSGTWHGQLHIEIECPIGTPMSHAQDYSHHPGENEVTLAAHLIYEILSVKKVGGTTVMRVRVIGVAK